MILSTEAVERCLQMNYRNRSCPFITRDVAQTIASWYVTEAKRDLPFKQFAEGRAFDPRALAQAAAEAIPAAVPTEVESLRALRDWAEGEC